VDEIQRALPGMPTPTGAVERPPELAAGAARLKAIDRRQLLLRSVVVEELIADDHPARAIWEFVGRLDLTPYTTQVRSIEGAAGRPAVDPQLLVSLWIYSYSCGISSAREIERRCEYDPAYQWLTGMDSVSAHTVSDFRVGHETALRNLFVQVLGLLSAEGLITLERVMQDGTKVRACAASSEFRTQSRIEQHLIAAQAAVEALETVSEEEGSRRAQRARERAARDKQARLEAALQQFDTLATAESRVNRVSMTDPEARVMHQANGGSAPSYNVQIATDAKHCVIVDIAATNAGSDYRQLTPAVDRVEQQLEKRPKQMVVDGGYISRDNIVALAARGIDLIGPPTVTDISATNRQKVYHYRGVQPGYEASQFQYDPTTNAYVCPEGKRLRYDAKDPRAGTIRYRYKAAAADCHACRAKSLCCPRTRTGRSIERREPLPAIAAFHAKMQTDDARAIYHTRSQIAEFPNLWIKAKLRLRQFRVRGVRKVALECLWAALTYDIQQWIRLRWHVALPSPTTT
jgi:transposase